MFPWVIPTTLVISCHTRYMYRPTSQSFYACTFFSFIFINISKQQCDNFIRIGFNYSQYFIYFDISAFRFVARTLIAKSSPSTVVFRQNVSDSVKMPSYLLHSDFMHQPSSSIITSVACARTTVSVSLSLFPVEMEMSLECSISSIAPVSCLFVDIAAKLFLSIASWRDARDFELVRLHPIRFCMISCSREI